MFLTTEHFAFGCYSGLRRLSQQNHWLTQKNSLRTIDLSSLDVIQQKIVPVADFGFKKNLEKLVGGDFNQPL